MLGDMILYTHVLHFMNVHSVNIIAKEKQELVFFIYFYVLNFLLIYYFNFFRILIICNQYNTESSYIQSN